MRPENFFDLVEQFPFFIHAPNNLLCEPMKLDNPFDNHFSFEPTPETIGDLSLVKCSKCQDELVVSAHQRFDSHCCARCENPLFGEVDKILSRDDDYLEFIELRELQKIREWSREYYQKNKEVLLLKSKTHRENNLEAFKKRDKLYYEHNKESIIKRAKQYKFFNFEKVRLQKKKYGKKYYASNKKKIVNQSTKWINENRERYNACRRRWVERKRAEKYVLAVVA